jgi:hypothetical protein
MKLRTRCLVSICYLLVVLSTMIIRVDAVKPSPAAIVTDTTIVGGSADISSSAYLDHAANVMIVIGISIDCQGGPCPTVGSVTIGGDRASQIPGAAVSSDIWVKVEVWYYYASSSGNDSIRVEISSSHTHAWGAAVFTGARSSNSFEDTATNSGYGTAPTDASVTVDGGTLGRRLIQFIGTDRISSAANISPGSDQTELTDSRVFGYPGTMEEMSYEDTANQVTMKGTIKPYGIGDIYWATVATAILPAGSYLSNATETETPAPTELVTGVIMFETLPIAVMAIIVAAAIGIFYLRRHGKLRKKVPIGGDAKV